MLCVAQVISLWLLFSLPVWSAAYKQAGADTLDWIGISQVSEDVPGLGAYAKYTPDYDGPTFRELAALISRGVPQHAHAYSRIQQSHYVDRSVSRVQWFQEHEAGGEHCS